MIAHVAEAGEDRGRVVVRMGEFVPVSPAAVAAAVHVARAFQSEVEGLFIEDPDVFSVASHAHVRVLTPTGRARPVGTRDELEFMAGQFSVAAQRRLAQAAQAAGVKFSARVVREAAVPALQAACAERGPWNIIAFAEPISAGHHNAGLAAAFAQVWGTTGYLVAGSRANWRHGPIVLAVEDLDRLTGMVRAAQRLAGVHGDPIWLLPVGEDEIGLDWLEGEIRLMLGEGSQIKMLPRPHLSGSGLLLRAALFDCAPRMVIARYGGVLLPAQNTADAVSELGCPAFLVH
jgi:hypothetical protein